ncbi:bestrophin-3 [Hyalella azteca]|uniref:Bestrophin-3 n=1 Tax=Hyalella azteca TaxID=294128 RepID=A0A8B7NKH7_HYAAZ|nr:bestrophin-3 [Hyalella azteca]
MTVTYTHHVASSKGFGCFWKLLFRWKGSIYKLVWQDLFFYMLLYGACSVTYRCFLDEPQKRVFERISMHCNQFTDLIPVAFVLGFYVSIVVQRWWNQYMSLPWPDSLALFVSTCIHGGDERSRVMRRTIMRYVNLTLVITLSMISPRVKKRFPTLDHVMEAGFLTSQEKKIFEAMNRKTTHPKYWMPLVWAGTIVSRARKEGWIRDDFAVKSLIDEISKFRGLNGTLLSYDWISIPLVYTQVVTLAVYTFFIGTIMGRQFLDPAQKIPNYTVDFYVPWFTFLQFFFYMGWLKVAETLVNPFGEDDDDFEVNWLIDRNLQVSYLIVDEMHEEHPDLIQDVYWDEVFPQSLPYTVASEPFRRMAPQGSTFNMQVPDAEQEIILVPLEEEDEDEGGTTHRRHVKIDMNQSGISRDSLHSSSSAIAMKVRSPRASMSEGRKGSVLSVLLNRVMHSNVHDANATRFSRLGSSLSIKSKRTNARLNRNSSRLSTMSHGSSGRESYSRPTPRGVPNSASVARSAISDELGFDDCQLSQNREVLLDEEGAILIRIKPDSERRPQSTKSAFESSTSRPSKTVLPNTSTASASLSSSPVLGVHVATSASSTSRATDVAGRAVGARLPPLPTPVSKKTANGRHSLAPLQMRGSLSSSGHTAAHLLSQELGSDEEVETPWGNNEPVSLEFPLCKSGETGTIRRKGKSPRDERLVSAVSQPCAQEDLLSPSAGGVARGAMIMRGLSVPNDWNVEHKMLDYNQDLNQSHTDSALCKTSAVDIPKKKQSSFADSGVAFPPSSPPPTPNTVLDLPGEFSVASLLEPESLRMSLSERFSTLNNVDAVQTITEPDQPSHVRKSTSIPEGLDVVNEENETYDDDSDNSNANCKPSTSPPHPPISSPPSPKSLKKMDFMKSEHEPPLFISESPNALSFDGRP